MNTDKEKTKGKRNPPNKKVSTLVNLEESPLAFSFIRVHPSESVVSNGFQRGRARAIRLATFRRTFSPVYSLAAPLWI